MKYVNESNEMIVSLWNVLEWIQLLSPKQLLKQNSVTPIETVTKQKFSYSHQNSYQTKIQVSWSKPNTKPYK